jgi:antitoxin component YwqK of YwqJK toxin-antitoxin module
VKHILLSLLLTCAAYSQDTTYKDGSGCGGCDSLRRGGYTSGALMFEYPTIKDTVQGVYKEYFESGELMCTWPYVNGVPEGTAKRYDKSGRLISKTTYRNGDLVLYQKCIKQNNCTN